jgi:peptidoglycan hydrolase CwlO-like protein
VLASVVALGLGLVQAAQGQDAGSGGEAIVDQGRSPAESRVLAERSAAEEILDTARDRFASAYQTLESLVTDLEDDHALLTTSAQAASHRNALAVAMTDSLDAARARLTSLQARSGRRPSRNARAKVLAEVFAESVAGASTVDDAWPRGSPPE